MTNMEKYSKVFTDIFKVEPESLNEGFVYRSVPVWDSIAHMELISVMEDIFDIMLDTDDILNFTSYEEGKKILKKYEIEL